MNHEKNVFIRRRCMRAVSAPVAGLLLALASLSAAAGFLSACSTSGVYVGFSRGGERASVDLEIPAPKVYTALLSVATSDPEIVILERNDENRTLSIVRGRDRGTCTVEPLEHGGARLTVKAKAPEGKARSMDLARRAVTQVCEELGVAYELKEE